MKICSKCRCEKDHKFFGRLPKSKDGLHSWCRGCLALWRKEDRAKRPEHYASVARLRYQKTGDVIRKKNREWHAERSPDVKGRRRAKFVENSEKYNENRRARFSADATLRARRSEANREWRIANAELNSARRREKWRNATPAQRLRSYFGAAISHALNGSGKGGHSWQQLVGYSSAQLKTHLERQFLPGMSWDNYGDGWHVDHVTPASSFKYSNYSDPNFRACWCLTNLRPLWAADNIKKRDKRTHLI